MGVTRAYLFVGNFMLEWNEFLPTPAPNFITFLFDESERYTKEEFEDKDKNHNITEDKTREYTSNQRNRLVPVQDQDYQAESSTFNTYPEKYITELGFKFTVKRCKEVMDSHGFTMSFFTEIYKFLRKDLRNGLISEYYEKANDKNDYKIISEIDALSPEEEISSYIEFMRHSITTNFRDGVFKEKKQLFVQYVNEPIRIPAHEYIFSVHHNVKENIVDLSSLLYFLMENCFKVPPFVLLLTLLFDTHNLIDYPEIMWLMYLRLMTEIATEDSIVDLCLNDLLRVTDDVNAFIEEVKLDSSSFLIKKINLYNTLFKILFENQQDLWEINAKSKSKLLISSLDTNELNSYDKGQALEELVDTLFSTHPKFRVTDKRYVTGDEEIDLVIQNNVEKPFWIALQSPLLFFECKNWSKPVGTKELRDFEGKMRNHSNIVRIGLFLSYKGFTAECIDELKRTGRDTQIVILISKEDIVTYINSTLTLIEWLENLIVKFK